MTFSTNQTNWAAAHQASKITDQIQNLFCQSVTAHNFSSKTADVRTTREPSNNTAEYKRKNNLQHKIASFVSHQTQRTQNTNKGHSCRQQKRRKPRSRKESRIQAKMKESNYVQTQKEKQDEQAEQRSTTLWHNIEKRVALRQNTAQLNEKSRTSERGWVMASKRI